MPTDRGFVVVPQVLEPSEVRGLRSDVERVRRGRAGVRRVLADAALRRLADDPRLCALATELLGSPATAFRGTLFDKSADTNWLVTWHQDLALPLRARVDAPGWGPWTHKGGRLHALAPAEVLARVVALRVHVDDNTRENGPLRVLPDTHHLGRLSETRISELARDFDAVECLAPAGGVVALRPLTVHASSKSSSATPRRVLHLEYTTTTVLGSGLELDDDAH
ncbi:MAG: phytanoyl-CoA dioxygenase family protein [Planctomycetes bacterium]|nr:phytanoyl-CoA dioxygenase family protein [Planctomycetota bacterium]